MSMRMNPDIDRAIDIHWIWFTVLVRKLDNSGNTIHTILLRSCFILQVPAPNASARMARTNTILSIYKNNIRSTLSSIRGNYNNQGSVPRNTITVHLIEKTQNS